MPGRNQEGGRGEYVRVHWYTTNNQSGDECAALTLGRRHRLPPGTFRRRPFLSLPGGEAASRYFRIGLFGQRVNNFG